MHALIPPLEGSNLPPVCCVVAMEKKANTRTRESPARCSFAKAPGRRGKWCDGEKQQPADQQIKVEKPASTFISGRNLWTLLLSRSAHCRAACLTHPPQKRQDCRGKSGNGCKAPACRFTPRMFAGRRPTRHKREKNRREQLD